MFMTLFMAKRDDEVEDDAVKSMTVAQRKYQTFCNNCDANRSFGAGSPTCHYHGQQMFSLFDNAKDWFSVICIYSVASSFAWIMMFMITGGSETGQAFFSNIAARIFTDPKGGVPFIALSLPILSAASICSYFFLPLTTRHYDHDFATGSNNFLFIYKRKLLVCFHTVFVPKGFGDLDVDRIALLFLAFPTMIYLLSRICTILFADNEDHATTEQRAQAIGNIIAIASSISMSFWLIPVSRHGILLQVLSCNPVKAIRLHMWCGWISLIGFTLHAFCHMVRWAYLLNENTIEMFIPPVLCWKRLSDDVTATTFSNSGPICNSKDTSCTCYDRFRNLTGIIAIISLVTITATSIERFRRKNYYMFYRIHVFLAPLFVTAAIMHWRRMILYLCPSLLYYAASTSPFIVQAIMSFRHGGVKLKSFTIIPDSDTVAELCFEASHEALAAINSTPQYAKICIPSFSYIWHPFSVFTSPARHRPTTLRIMFRATGKFTQHLMNALVLHSSTRVSNGASNVPLLLFDGFYGGGLDRVQQALRHDAIIMVAGGIGITYFLSFLPSLLSVLSAMRRGSSHEYRTKEVYLHWICRDTGLVNYIMENYFAPSALENYVGGDHFKLVICIHYTGKKRFPKQDIADGGAYVATEDLTLGLLHSISNRHSNTNDASNSVGYVAPAFMSRNGRTSRIKNFTPSFVCLTTYWIGLVIIWNQYVYLKSDERVWIQLPGLLFICGVSFFISIFAISIAHWYKKPHLLARKTSISELPRCYCLSSSLDASTKTSHLGLAPSAFGVIKIGPEGTEISGRVTIQERIGRPAISSILNNKSEVVDSTGVVVCGPVSLLQDIRNLSPSLSNEFSEFVIYEEPFCL